MKLKHFFTASAVALAASSPASALVLDFDLTGDYTASWTIDTAAVQDESLPGSGFGYYDVAGNYPGLTFDYVADIRFYSAAAGGGFTLVDHYDADALIVSAGPTQLYSGTEAAPLFKLGTFNLQDPTTPLVNYTLTISAVPVPEPKTWAMLMLGFGAVGGALRARPRRARANVAFA